MYTYAVFIKLCVVSVCLCCLMRPLEHGCSLCLLSVWSERLCVVGAHVDASRHNKTPLTSPLRQINNSTVLPAYATPVLMEAFYL